MVSISCPLILMDRIADDTTHFDEDSKKES
jgi:hypothetical protein